MEKDNGKRELTHDEKKAMEAAFTGKPFNPAWSEAARIVYEGVAAAMNKKASAPAAGASSEEKPLAPSPSSPDKTPPPAPQ